MPREIQEIMLRDKFKDDTKKKLHKNYNTSHDYYIFSPCTTLPLAYLYHYFEIKL